jgi:hypothetical protein
MKRFGRSRHYLDSQAQSEQAAALKTTTLCRAVVCSYWLVIDRWGALLGELCSLLVNLASAATHSFHHANFVHNQRQGSQLPGAATIHKVCNKSEEREVENRVCQNSDPQKPAKRPSERLAGFRSDQLGQLQSG